MGVGSGVRRQGSAERVGQVGVREGRKGRRVGVGRGNATGDEEKMMMLLMAT